MFHLRDQKVMPDHPGATAHPGAGDRDDRSAVFMFKSLIHKDKIVKT